MWSIRGAFRNAPDVLIQSWVAVAKPLLPAVDGARSMQTYSALLQGAWPDQPSGMGRRLSFPPIPADSSCLFGRHPAESHASQGVPLLSPQQFTKLPTEAVNDPAGNFPQAPLTAPAAYPAPAWWRPPAPAPPGAAPAGRAGMPGVVPAAGGNGARHRETAWPGPGGRPA